MLYDLAAFLAEQLAHCDPRFFAALVSAPGALFGSPPRGVDAKSCNCWWLIDSSPRLALLSFEGSCSAIAIAICCFLDTAGIVHLSNNLVALQPALSAPIAPREKP
jgi:hypothetical protein